MRNLARVIFPMWTAALPRAAGVSGHMNKPASIMKEVLWTGRMRAAATGPRGFDHPPAGKEAISEGSPAPRGTGGYFTRPAAHLLLWWTVVAAAYVAGGQLGLSLAFVNASASAVWPPTGIAIAAVLLFGPRMAPAIFLGAYIVNLTSSGDHVSSAFIALGNMGEALVAGFLVQRFAGGRHAFERASDAYRFVLLAGGIATSVSATVGVATLILWGLAPIGAAQDIWFTWWLGDGAGALIVAPVIILWANRTRIRWTANQAFEALALTASLAVVGLAVFGGPLGSAPLVFLAVPVVVWAAYRFGPREAATATFILSIVAIAGTLRGSGPFAGPDPNANLLILQTFMGVLAVLALPFAALVAERHHDQAALEAAREELEARVEARTRELTLAVGALESQVQERSRAEARLDESRRQLAHAQVLARIGSWSWNVGADAVEWSDELYRIYGLDRDTMTPTFDGFIRLLPEDERDRVTRLLQSAIEGTATQLTFEHRFIHGTGDERWLDARAEITRDDKGTPIRMHGTAQDITDRKKADLEQKVASERLREITTLRSQEAFRQNFMNMAAHELSTPLTPIKVQLHLLDRALNGTAERAPDPVALKTMGIVNRNIDRLAELVRDLLDAARLESDRLSLDTRPVDVARVIADAADAYQENARAQGVSIVLEGESEGLLVDGDDRRLGQVVDNLLSNALKFTPEGGTVILRASRDNGRVVASVTDTGDGIDPAVQARLFQPFSQVHDTQRNPKGGTGLGLHICRGIMDLHGGSIRCESDGQGKGTRFIFDLPAAGGGDPPRPA